MAQKQLWVKRKQPNNPAPVLEIKFRDFNFCMAVGALMGGVRNSGLIFARIEECKPFSTDGGCRFLAKVITTFPPVFKRPGKKTPIPDHHGAKIVNRWDMDLGL